MNRPIETLQHPADELVRTMERIYRYRMTTTSGGNLSILDADGSMWITPSRVDKGSLRAQDMVRIFPDGRVEGVHPPSSEHPFHRRIYQARPDIRAIVHAHPVALVAFSICRKIPDTLMMPQSRHVCGAVGYAPYALPGSKELGEKIAVAFAGGAFCVMLENHGVVIGGSTLQQAFERFETLEFTAQTLICAAQLGGARVLTRAQLELSRKQRPDLPEFKPVSVTTAEKALRRDLSAFVQRGYKQRLLTSTEGSFSARLDEESFLITSYQVDRQDACAEDLTLVRAGQREFGKQPSRASAIHQAIYRRHPGVKAIVNAMPVHATAFSVTAAELDARTIPESYIFLREVPKIPFVEVYEAPDRLAERISADQPVALVENNGALVLGTSILDAFDRLEVLETTAEAILQGMSVGKLVPMDSTAIAELKAAFLAG